MAKINRERLAYAMSQLRLSQAELARRASISPAAVQQMLNGKIKTTRAIREIADALSVNRDWLEGLTDDPLSDMRTNDPSDKEVRVIPYSTNSSGKPVLKFLQLSSFWLDQISSDSTASVLVMAVILSGSMAPTLMPQDNVLVRLSDKFDGKPNSIWFVLIDGETVYRRVRATSVGFHLSADNPIVTPVELNAADVGFYGEVIWQGRKINP